MSNPPSLDVARLRGAFIRAGIVWVLPAHLFEEAVVVVAREYDNPPPALVTPTAEANAIDREHARLAPTASQADPK